MPLEKHAPDRFEAVADRLGRAERILVLTHLNPDGDALGSQLALGEALLALGKRVTMFYDGEVSDMYAFLPGLDRVAPEPGSPEDYDLVVLLDCHELPRTGRRTGEMARVPDRLILDHHVADGDVPSGSIIDAGASATGELVWRLLEAMGVRPTPAMATNLFVAVTTDTGSFSFENTTPGCLEAAAGMIRAGAVPWNVFTNLYLNRSLGRLKLLGLALNTLELFHQGSAALLTVTADMVAQTGSTMADTDGFVEYPRSIKGVELAVFLRETGPDRWKLSLRSRGRVNVDAIARHFGGGGHVQAAGASLEGDYEECRRAFIEVSTGHMPEDPVGRA